jgi:hypothetical protein
MDWRFTSFALASSFGAVFAKNIARALATDGAGASITAASDVLAAAELGREAGSVEPRREAGFKTTSWSGVDGVLGI